MLGFKSTATAPTILSGIEMIRIMRKRQARYAFNPIRPRLSSSNPRRLIDLASGLSGPYSVVATNPHR